MHCLIKKQKYFLFIILVIISNSTALIARSIHRPIDPLMPEINASWKGESVGYTLRNSHLEEYPYFKIFNKEYLDNYTLPDEPITYRNNEKQTVEGATLKKLIQRLLAEIKARKQKFTDFILLQEKDFNRTKGWGLIVLKFKNYPFVLKLFIETPKSFVNPFNKGIEPIFFFFMGGGVNRHLTGFTRIKNREDVLEKLKSYPDWAQKIDVPRKWFWIPPESKWIVLKGKNIGPQGVQSIEIPGIYCLIADAIESDRKFSIGNVNDRRQALALCNDMETLIDPHIKNFMVEKKTGTLTIVDSEHFPSAVGLKSRKRFKTYTQWYFHLMSKFFYDVCLRTKRERRLAQTYGTGRYLTY